MGLTSNWWKLAVAIALPLQIALVAWITRNPEWIEVYYSQGIYKYLSLGIRASSRLIPVPVGQLIFYSLLLVILVSLTRLIAKRWKGVISWGQFLRRLLLDSAYFFSIIYFFFMITWGLNYHRLPVAEIQGLDVEAVGTDELIEMCGRLIQQCNDQRKQLVLKDGELDLTKKEILTKAAEGFTYAPERYEFLRYDLPSVKSVYVPELMSLFGVGGIYFMFTAEANVNMGPPNFLVPSTTCHEMAHQLGFASEDEANYIGYLATQFNSDKNFQYSGNLMAMRYSMRALYRTDSVQYNQLVKNISEDVLSDIRVTREYWLSFDNPIEPISDAIYDQFLKANNQKAGIASYSQVVKLFVGEYRRNGMRFSSAAPAKTSESP